MKMRCHYCRSTDIRNTHALLIRRDEKERDGKRRRMDGKMREVNRRVKTEKERRERKREKDIQHGGGLESYRKKRRREEERVFIPHCRGASCR